ncbi:DUF5994 family protein [Mycolicibacterium tokaiense]|uniref:DUF5994 family protein n=1 Tax=Mycolicibacterium tokaiense TaxID=39695 RepID=UPI00235434A2|nr:DUF5994 family protein [Mycolicibacterium tokaiense]
MNNGDVAAIDGAWWPHTASVSNELPELIERLQPRLGVVENIRINWSATEGPLGFTDMWSRAAKSAHPCQAPRLMAVSGRDAAIRLLVIPYLTSPELGQLVLALAAARPVAMAPADPKLSKIGDYILSIATAESRRWCGEPETAALQHNTLKNNNGPVR